MLNMYKPSNAASKDKGFTIVELLIVVVVIAILATITVVAYNGIQSRARDAQLKSDLKSAATQLALYNTQNGTFPPSQASDAGVKDSSSTKFTYTYNPGDNTYCLVGVGTGITYTIGTNQQTPGQYVCLSTMAGSPDGVAGHSDGIGVNALLTNPGNLSLGADNFLYVKDGNGFPTYLRKIDPTTASVTTIFTTNTTLQAMAIASNGTIYATSVYPMCIQKIVSGIMTTIGCPAITYPTGIAIGSDGYLYVTDGDSIIYKINPTNGAMTILAGGATKGYVDSTTGTVARFTDVGPIVAGSDGNLYVGDAGNNRIRKVTLAGVVTTVAGTGGSGYVDGAVAQAQINSPYFLAIDSANTIYVMDADGRVRKITSGGTVSTLANGKIFPNGSGITASPTSAGTVYVDSFTSHAIYKLQ